MAQSMRPQFASAPKKAALDQAGGDDGFGDILGRLLIRRAAHTAGQKVRGPFPVRRDGPRKKNANLFERGNKGIVRRPFASYNLVARQTVRH